MLYTYELSCHSCHLWSILLVSVTNYTALFLMWPHLVDTLPHSHAGRWHSPWCWTHPPQQAEGGWAHAMWGWDLWIPKMWWCPSTPSHRTLLFVEWDECPGDSWRLVVRPGSIVRHSCPSLCVVCWAVSPWRWMWQFLSSCVKWVRWDIQRRNRGYAETCKLNTSELCVLQQPDDINKSGAEIACSLADANQFHWNCLLFLSWILISQTVSHSYSLSDKNLSSTMKQFCLLKHFI